MLIYRTEPQKYDLVKDRELNKRTGSFRSWVKKPQRSALSLGFGSISWVRVLVSLWQEPESLTKDQTGASRSNFCGCFPPAPFCTSNPMQHVYLQNAATKWLLLSTIKLKHKKEKAKARYQRKAKPWSKHKGWRVEQRLNMWGWSCRILLGH